MRRENRERREGMKYLINFDLVAGDNFETPSVCNTLIMFDCKIIKKNK